MNIIYNLNLKDCQEIKKRDYLNYSTIEISNNLLFGEVAFVDKKKDNSLFFEAEILKFFIDIYDALIAVKSKKTESQAIFSMEQNYMFNIEIEKRDVILTFNKKKILKYDLKQFLSELKRSRQKLFDEFKILYSDYNEIVNIDFLFKAFK